MYNEIPMEEKQKIFKESIDAIMLEAEALGINNEDDSAYSVLDTLSEASTYNTKGTVIQLSKAGKMNWYRSRVAIAYARANKDALYTKLVKYTRLRKEALTAIQNKYKSKSTARAKQLMKNTKGTTNVYANKKKKK